MSKYTKTKKFTHTIIKSLKNDSGALQSLLQHKYYYELKYQFHWKKGGQITDEETDE